MDKVVPLLQERGVFRTEYDGTTLRDHLGLAPLGLPAVGGQRAGGVMRFITITLIVHAPDPVTGAQMSTADRFREVLDNARLAEELGFDGFGVGERHERPFISSSPTVVLSHVAAPDPEDPAVHRGDHAEAARPGARVRGLRDARPPLRRAA